MQKLKSIILSIAILCFFCGCYSDNRNRELYKEIDNYKKLLDKEKSNCFYLGQIAAAYQHLYDFDNAIIFYEKSINLCPDDTSNIFQLGISYYVIMNKDKGIFYMEKAIEIADRSNDNELSKVLRDERDAWLANWDLVKKQKWNIEKNNSK